MNQPNPNPYAAPSSEVTDRLGQDVTPITRKRLVPLWIKIFGWIFMLMGVAVPIIAIAATVMGEPASYEIFGLQYRGTPFHPMALLISTIIWSLAVSAYGLLFGKSWGLQACLVTGYMGVAICIGTTVYAITQGSLMLRLELLLQIPYLIKLHKIQSQWPLASAR
jgi:uncharacterized membrane protein